MLSYVSYPSPTLYAYNREKSRPIAPNAALPTLHPLIMAPLAGTEVVDPLAVLVVEAWAPDVELGEPELDTLRVAVPLLMTLVTITLEVNDGVMGGGTTAEILAVGGGAGAEVTGEGVGTPIDSVPAGTETETETGTETGGGGGAATVVGVGVITGGTTTDAVPVGAWI